MTTILVNDEVWVSSRHTEERYKGKVVVVKEDGTEAVVTIGNGINIRVPTNELELRESHE